jgi:hypothetical protein
VGGRPPHAAGAAGHDGDAAGDRSAERGESGHRAVTLTGPVGRPRAIRQTSAHDRWAELIAGLGHLLWTIAVTAVLCIPLAVSLWALLDAARRPAWAWSLADRNQAMWIAFVLVGFCSVIGGLVISAVYLLRVRPRIAAAEAGRLAELT